MARDGVAVKKINALVTLGFPHGGGDKRVSIRIQDADSRLMIIEFDVLARDFLDFMSCNAATPATAEVWNTYDKLGKTQEIQGVTIKDERLKGYGRNADLWRQIIDDNRDKFELDGWVMDYENPNHLSQGQHDSTNGTLRVTMRRYLEKEVTE